MPADTTKTTTKSNTERRRTKGEIACAECRRLKIRCDKKIPCSPCTRRGCAVLCPNGSLSTSRPRIVLADNEELYRKLVQMSERIRQLEDALQVSTPSHERHPLLTDELLAIKHGFDTFFPNEKPSDGDQDSAQEDECPVRTLNETFGTLAITNEGGTRFIGCTGSAEVVLLREITNQDHSDLMCFGLSPLHANACPFAASSNLRDREVRFMNALSHLPSKERMSTLCEAYLENVSWLYDVVGRSQLLEELVPSIYKKHVDSVEQFKVEPHDLSLLLMICAMGEVGDLSKDTNDEESFAYFRGARIAFSLRCASKTGNLATIQTLFLMSLYVSAIGAPHSLEITWLGANLAKSLAISMGLHRDPAHWDFDNSVKQRRRQIFWELFVMDNWQALASGRPTLFSTYMTDCQFPDDKTFDKQGNTQQSFQTWSYQFNRDLLSTVTHRMASCQPLKIADILDLDRRVREFPPHPYANMQLDGLFVAEQGTKTAMHVLLAFTMRDMVLLYIHRNFFAKAVRDPALDPLATAYVASFLSAYRSSIAILKHTRKFFTLLPGILSRCWHVWNHVVVAIIVVASVVATRPQSDLAPTALCELGLACDMCEKAAPHSSTIKRILPLIMRLRSKAYRAYTQHRDLPEDVTGTAFQDAHADASSLADELAALGGEARTVAVTLLSDSASDDSTTSSSEPWFSEGGTPAAALPHPACHTSTVPLKSVGDGLFFETAAFAQNPSSAYPDMPGIFSNNGPSQDSAPTSEYLTHDQMFADFMPEQANQQSLNNTPGISSDEWEAFMNKSGMLSNEPTDMSFVWSSTASFLQNM